MLAALSIRANNSPPNKLFNGLVSPGNTKSVNVVTDSEGNFGCIVFFAKIMRNLKTKHIKKSQFWDFNGFYSMTVII
jgi:hypothetical protein